MKNLDPHAVMVATLIALLGGMTLAYHHHQNALNRQAYYECLRVTEGLAQADQRGGVRIVSTPSCYLR